MDKLGIINSALMKCGLPLAATLNDCDWNATTVFDNSRNEVLRSFAWGFATKYVALTGNTTPSFGMQHSYALPADCMRVVDVHTQNDLRSPDCRYTISGKNILTHASPCYLRYVSNESEPADWPPDFCDVVSCKIAMEIAPLSAQTMSLTPQLAQLYQLALAQAQATDARESMERVPHDVNILLSRTGGEDVGKRG